MHDPDIWREQQISAEQEEAWVQDQLDRLWEQYAGLAPWTDAKSSNEETGMSDTIRREALIHDLAIVLAGSLHPGAKIGPAPRLAARRMQDVLGIADGAPVGTIEPLIAAALEQPGHYHDATGHEDTLCHCPSPLTYAPQYGEQ